MNALERKIRFIARRYARDPDDLKDLIQIGHIKAWELMPEHSEAYVLTSIKNAYLETIVRNNAKKRRPEGGFVSLNKKISSYDDLTIGDTIGRLDNHDFEVNIVETLKDKYNFYYVEGIKKEKRPREIVRNIIRYCIEELSGLTTKEIPEKVDYAFFKKHGLGRLLYVFYDGSPVKAVMDSFEGFVPWNFSRAGTRYWSGNTGYDHAVDAVKWFINKNDLHDAEDCKKITTSDFEKDGLSGMLQKVFNDSPYLALKSVFPDLKPWQMKSAPFRFYNEEKNRKYAITEYMISTGVGNIELMTTEELFDTNFKVFSTKEAICDAGLRGILAKYDGSTYSLFSSLFPLQIKPWSLKGNRKAWAVNPKETAGEAIRWLFDRYLGLSIEEIPEYASCSLFWNMGFSGIMSNKNIGFNASPFKALDNAYPGVFMSIGGGGSKRIKLNNLNENENINKPEYYTEKISEVM